MKDMKEQLQEIRKILSKETKNNLKFIDTHAHYNHNKIKYRNQLLKNLQTEVKYIINIGTNAKSNTETLQLVSLFDYIYGMIGFFPTDVWQLEPDLCPNDIDIFTFKASDNYNVFIHQLLNQKIVGIGEIGLDYHWDYVGPMNLKTEIGIHGEKKLTGIEARKIQQKWFLKQLELAKEKNLPVSMHSRDAEEDTLKIFSNFNTIKGVMHCFSYGWKSANEYLKKGLYLGIGGTSTYPSNEELRNVIKKCPLERILLETDAPYLSPQPVRKKVNNSSYITYVIDNIATIKNISREEVIEQTNKNAIELFKFPK